MKNYYSKINWIRGLEIDRHDHEVHFEAHSEHRHKNDIDYIGIWIEIDGEFSEVTEIKAI